MALDKFIIQFGLNSLQSGAGPYCELGPAVTECFCKLAELFQLLFSFYLSYACMYANVSYRSVSSVSFAS